MKNTLLALLTFFNVTLYSQSSNEEISIKVISSGIYENETVEKEHLNTSPTGNHLYSKNYRLIKQTNEIPGKINLSFGTKYIIESNKDESITMEQAWIYPKKIKNKRGKKFKEVRYQITKNTNHITYATYEFEDDYELVKGEWEFQIKYNGKIIFNNKFTVN